MNCALEDINNSLSSINHLPAKKRLDAILSSEAPLKLVHALKTHDILLTIRELGPESSLELMEMLDPQQVRELLDLEIWSKDRLNVAKAGSYLALLFAANGDTAVKQIHGLDIELIGLMFKTVAQIYDQSLSEGPNDLPSLYSISPDNRFLVCFSEKPKDRNLAQSLYTFLERLYGRDLKFALRLLETIRFELASLLEEESARFRQNRLLDFGILPEEERLEYFSQLLPRDMKQVSAPLNSSDNALQLQVFNEKVDRRFPYLNACLSGLSNDRKRIFLQQVAFASVNMYASLAGDFGDREHMRKVSDYVKFLLELSLFHLCQGHIENARSGLLATTSAKYLIRLGRTTLVTLRSRIRKAVNDNNYIFGKDFCHVDSPLREVARALMLPEPRYYEGLLDPKKLTIKYFSTLTELNAALSSINELLFRAQFVGKSGLATNQELLKDQPHLSHAGIFARALINTYLGNANPLATISESSLSQIFEESGKIQNSFSRFAQSFTKAKAENLARHSDRPAEDTLDRANSLLTAVLIQLEQNSRLLIG